MKLKKAIQVLRGDFFCRSRKSIMGEKKLSVDEEHKPYVRGKRTKRNLPDTMDTKWISRKGLKNWKNRVKKRSQWEKHEKTIAEERLFNDNFDEEKFIEKYNTPNWRSVSYDYYDQMRIRSAIDKGILEGFYVKIRNSYRTFEDGDGNRFSYLPWSKKERKGYKEIVVFENKKVIRYARMKTREQDV